jgi:DNA-binding CsgD family transcriptional regulator
MQRSPADMPRTLIAAEQQTPKTLHDFLRDLEGTRRSVDVWRLLVQLGRMLELPFIDFITASSFRDWRKTLFVRTSYDARWLNELNADPELQKWSYFRTHALNYLTPIMTGLEFIDDFHPVAPARRQMLEIAAQRGMRSGFSVPLRIHAPPQAGLITFSGDHARRDMLTIIRAHGWTLNVAALAAHQRYVMHFSAEFAERNAISDKQRELLQMLGRGLPDKEIADRLGISVSAVRQRMLNLTDKTGIANRSGLAALAMSIGLVPDPLMREQTEEEEVDVLVEMDSGGVSSHRERTVPPGRIPLPKAP